MTDAERELLLALAVNSGMRNSYHSDHKKFLAVANAKLPASCAAENDKAPTTDEFWKAYNWLMLSDRYFPNLMSGSKAVAVNAYLKAQAYTVNSPYVDRGDYLERYRGVQTDKVGIGFAALEAYRPAGVTLDEFAHSVYPYYRPANNVRWCSNFCDCDDCNAVRNREIQHLQAMAFL